MRRQSLKRAALNRKWGPIRKEFAQSYRNCNCCGGHGQLHCHEITRGFSRDAAISKRCSWLAVCSYCNCEKLTDAALWPLPRQLALKWLYDREHFDLDCICELRGAVPGCVTMTDVIPWVCRLIDKEGRWV